MKPDISNLLKNTAFGILLLWALWATVVTITDFFSLLTALHVLPADFPAASGNFDLVIKFLKYYNIQHNLLACILFSMINVWILVISILYWKAVLTFHQQNQTSLRNTILAFMANMSLTSFFLIIDEIFIQYRFAHGHMNMLLFTLVSFLAFLYLTRLTTPLIPTGLTHNPLN